MSNITPTTPKDTLYAVVKGGLGSIPFAGALASEILGLLVASPLEKRREEWMTNVGQRLIDLEKGKKIDFEKISNSPEFIDVVSQATGYALKTSDKEKIELFKNVIINSALGIIPDQIINQIFLKLIDDYTILHIKLLHFFNNPTEWFTINNQPVPNFIMGNLSSVVMEAFPTLARQSNLLDIIWSDLGRAGLQNSGDLKAMMGGSGALASRTTDLGKQFLKFIQIN